MKKKVYVLCFVIFGILVSFMIHAFIEIAYIRLLVGDYERFGFGLNYDTWSLIHTYIAIALMFLGILFGYKYGQYFWKVLYVDQRYRKWLKGKLKTEF